MVARDSTDDAAAALRREQARYQLGYDDPSVTIPGQDARTVRIAMQDAYAPLLDLEERTKVFHRDHQPIRTRCVVPEARSQNVSEPPK